MNSEAWYQIDHRTAGFWVDGKLTFPQTVHACDAAIRSAIERGLDGLLLMGAAIPGSYIPTMAERHGMVRRWAATAEGRLTVAMVVQRELIDSEKFAVVAAANFGLVCNVFACPQDGELWLRETLYANESAPHYRATRLTSANLAGVAAQANA